MAIESILNNSGEIVNTTERYAIGTAQTLAVNIIRDVNLAIEATGLTVIIDVFRAFTTECFVLKNGAEYIIPISSLEEAYELKRQNPGYILMGERGGLPEDEFNYGNSPTEILGVDFTGKIVIHTTSNGTKGMMSAINADEIITGSFVNAGAIIEYIKNSSNKEITLVSTSPKLEELNEDMILAYYIRDVLQGEIPNIEEIKQKLKQTSAAFRLLEKGIPDSDIELCLKIDEFKFIIQKEKRGERDVLVKKDI